MYSRVFDGVADFHLRENGIQINPLTECDFIFLDFYFSFYICYLDGENVKYQIHVLGVVQYEIITISFSFAVRNLYLCF